MIGNSLRGASIKYFLLFYGIQVAANRIVTGASPGLIRGFRASIAAEMCSNVACDLDSLGRAGLPIIVCLVSFDAATAAGVFSGPSDRAAGADIGTRRRGVGGRLGGLGPARRSSDLSQRFERLTAG